MKKEALAAWSVPLPEREGMAAFECAVHGDGGTAVGDGESAVAEQTGRAVGRCTKTCILVCAAIEDPVLSKLLACAKAAGFAAVLERGE